MNGAHVLGPGVCNMDQGAIPLMEVSSCLLCQTYTGSCGRIPEGCLYCSSKMRL